jgi:hypothetical protein
MFGVGRSTDLERTYRNDMTYTELIKHNGASSTEKALEQRARRLAQRKGVALNKFRTPNVSNYGVCEYWCDNQLFKTVEDVIDYLAEAKA